MATIVDAEFAMQAYRDNRSTWDALLQRNQQQAVAFGFVGTPAFVIATRHYAGGLNPRALTEAIEDAGAA